MDKVILLVEDNPDDEALCIRALRKCNVANEIIVARDGVEALDMLLGAAGRPPIQPAIVLMDLKLPRLDGVETLNLIRANKETQSLPVVMLTTSDEERDILRSYDSGVNSYIRKPVDFAEFSDAAQQLGMYWLLLNQKPASDASSGS